MELKELDESLRYNKKGKRLTDNQLRLRMKQHAERNTRYPHPVPTQTEDNSWIVYTGPDNPPWL